MDVAFEGTGRVELTAVDDDAIGFELPVGWVEGSACAGIAGGNAPKVLVVGSKDRRPVGENGSRI